MTLPLHPQVKRTGWIGSRGGKFHLFMPGITTSECGMFSAEDSTERSQSVSGPEMCRNCLRVMAAMNKALRNSGIQNSVYGYRRK